MLLWAQAFCTVSAGQTCIRVVRFGGRRPTVTYPYRNFPRRMTLFSPDLRSHQLVSPIRLSVLGRTYDTYLHYKRPYSIIVFFGGSGSRGSGLTCRQKRQSTGIFSCNSGNFSPRFRGFSPAIPGIFPRDSGDSPPRFCRGEMTKCAYCLGAPDAMMMVRTATPVLHDAWTRCSMLCDGRKPAESGGHFGGHDT